MADNVNVTTVVSHPNWGAIWAGVFTFLGIWTVWGLLEVAVFASTANRPGARAAMTPVGGSHWAMAIWSIILTIVALFFAGRVTGSLAGIANIRDSAVHGMITFGLCMASALVVVTLLGRAIPPPAILPGTARPWLDAGATVGYAGFIGTFLGWLATMWGASMGTRSLLHREASLEEPGTRRAA